MSSYSIQFQTSLNKAQQGDPVEQYIVGHCYQNGIGVSIDKEKAQKFSDLALVKLKLIQWKAEQGNAQAQFVWANLHANGQGVRQNDKTAGIWYRKAAEQGNAESQFYLGYMCEIGLGVQQNYDEAVKWYRKAAEQGNTWGQCNLGRMYENGFGVQQSYTEAVKWYRKSAEQGNSSAQNGLGCMYQRGFGVQQSYTEAAKWYRKSAEQGNSYGQFNLALRFRYGRGVQQSYDEAVKWYRKSAEQGNSHGENDLGDMYEKGLGVQKDYDEAVKWYRKSAEQGSAWGQLSLGLMYENGLGVQQNFNEALKWYKKSAEQGNKKGQNNLGFMHKNGLGTQQNYHEAVEWYRKAAEQEDTNGQNNLGGMYEIGLGVQKDYDEAVKWYRKSAEQGNTWGQYNLGRMYENGFGVQQSYDEAIKWYQKAVEQGHVQAQNSLELIQKQAQSTQQNNNKNKQELPEMLAEQRKAEELRDKTQIGINPTPSSHKTAILQTTAKTEPVKPSQQKKFKQALEQEKTEDSAYQETLLSQHWKIKSYDLKDKVEVGAGGCGKVYRGLWQGAPVAIKEIHGRLGSAELEELRKEALIMSQLHHPHVIHLFGITPSSPHCLVMEWMEKGSFYDALRNEQLSFEQKGKILLGAARGLAFLHSKNMVHRDIKSLNILLKKSFKAKIGDFGLSQVKKSLYSQSNHDSSLGTLHWKAPELFKLGGKHTTASDIYAFGIVMWEALTEKKPYEEVGDTVQITTHIQRGGRPEIPQETPDWYRQLTERCWSQNPQDRPTAEEVASIIEKKLSEEQSLLPTQLPQSNPFPSGYLLNSHKPVDKSANRIPLSSGYLDLD